MPEKKSDLLIVAMKPVKAGGAKGEMVARPEERHFLGFRLRRNPDGQVEVHLSQRTVERLKLRIGELTSPKLGAVTQNLFRGIE